MDLSQGIRLSLLLAIAFCSYTQSSQLYLQPVKSDHAYFTGDNFFVTCFTTDDNIDKLTWTDFESNPISTTEGRIHAQPAEGDQLGLRLVFTNVETEDAGTYTCSDDQDSVNFDLTVYRAVSFSDTEREQHASEGETGAIFCNVRSDPKPVVNWYFEGTKISNNKKYSIHPENHSLKIHNLSRSDAGEYKCKAFVITHLSSQVKDFDINFHVQYVPEIVGDPKSFTFASLGSKKNLTCTVTADPAPLFEWLFDEMIIHNNTKNFVIHNTHNSSVLQMAVDDTDRFGEYTCRASNALGKKEVIIELKEGETPKPPELSVSGEDNQGVVRLSLKTNSEDDFEDDLRVSGFRVQYVLATDTWNNAASQDFKMGESYELKNLSFNSDYVLRAAAHNAAGYGNYSTDLPYKTHSPQTAQVVGAAPAIFSTTLPLLSFVLFLGLL